jgi:branched-chain amino acid transport system substrate-binding protein
MFSEYQSTTNQAEVGGVFLDSTPSDFFYLKTRRFNINIRRITRFTFVLAIAALIAWLSACDELVSTLSSLSDGETPQMEGLSGEIPVGVVLPLTGRLVSSFGLPMGHGFDLALEEINNSQLGDVRIKFITEDDQSTVEGAVEAYNKLIHQDSVPAILGPATSSATKEAFPIAQENQVVAFSPTSAARSLSAIGDFVFRAALTTDVLIPSGVRATHAKLGYQRVATIYDKIDPYSIDSHEKFMDTLTENGVKILTTETFQSDDTDFSDQLARIKALNPDAIFIAALPPELTGILIQGRQLGISTEVPFITSLISDVENAGPAAEGAISFAGWISTASTPGNQAFVHNYRATYDSEPNPWTAQSYAAVHILAKAIGNAQSTHPVAIRDALANIRDFDTVLGKFSFDADGDAVYDPIILIVENGQFEVFE